MGESAVQRPSGAHMCFHSQGSILFLVDFFLSTTPYQWRCNVCAVTLIAEEKKLGRGHRWLSTHQAAVNALYHSAVYTSFLCVLGI